jgi:hypothetical protein
MNDKWNDNLEIGGDLQDEYKAIQEAEANEGAPVADSKAAMIEIFQTLGHIMAQHASGLPVYAEMAARIDGRETEKADEMVREALGDCSN